VVHHSMIPLRPPHRGFEPGAMPLEFARVCKAWARVTGRLLALARIRVPRLSPIGNRKIDRRRPKMQPTFFRRARGRRGVGCSAYRQSGTAEIDQRRPKMQPTFFSVEPRGGALLEVCKNEGLQQIVGLAVLFPPLRSTTKVAVGQTAAAHDLCSGLSPYLKRRHM